MKKIICVLIVITGLLTPVHAQSFKQLGNVLPQATKTVDKSKKNDADKTNNSKSDKKATVISKKTSEKKQTTSQTKGSVQSSSDKTVSKKKATNQQEDSILIIKNRTFAGIRLGMKMSKVPQSVPGIYDGYEEDARCEIGISYWCKVTVPGEYNYLEISDDDENGIIDGIMIQIPGVRIAGTDIVIGTPISEIINTPGLKKKVDKYSPEYYEYIYQGIYHIQDGTLNDNKTNVVTSISWSLH